MADHPAANGDVPPGFELLEARHVDNLTESVRSLSQNIVSLNRSVEKLTRLLDAAPAPKGKERRKR